MSFLFAKITCPGGCEGRKERGMKIKYSEMTDEQLLELQISFTARGNLNAAAEIYDFRKTFGKTVEVVKGRKVPIGIIGTCFWVKRYNYSRYADPWGIYSDTRIGIKTAEGKTYFTSLDNVKVVNN